MIEEQIRELDDRTAGQMLAVIARTRMREGDFETELSPEMAEALQEEFNVQAEAGGVTAGDLAREALLLLARDPEHQKKVMNLLIGPEQKTFGVDPVTAAAVITGALVVLQTEVIIKKDKDGKWTFSLKKKSASDGLLKAVVGKLTGLMSK